MQYFIEIFTQTKFHEILHHYICDFLLVINTNFPPILHRFRIVAVDRSKIAIF